MFKTEVTSAKHLESVVPITDHTKMNSQLFITNARQLPESKQTYHLQFTLSLDTKHILSIYNIHVHKALSFDSNSWPLHLTHIFSM